MNSTSRTIGVKFLSDATRTTVKVPDNQTGDVHVDTLAMLNIALKGQVKSEFNVTGKRHEGNGYTAQGKGKVLGSALIERIAAAPSDVKVKGRDAKRDAKRDAEHAAITADIANGKPLVS